MNYVIFEGIDGCGKTTQLSLLCDMLPKRNITPIRLAEPTYGQFGAVIREHMQRGNPVSLERQRELFTLDRREHVSRKINPLLQFIQGSGSFMIIQDRCYLSAPAYQAEDHEAMRRVLAEQQAFAPKPDIIFLLDIPVQLAMERLKARGGRPALFEDPRFLEKVRERFMFLAKEGSERIEVLDGTMPAERICELVLGILDLRRDGG